MKEGFVRRVFFKYAEGALKPLERYVSRIIRKRMRVGSGATPADVSEHLLRSLNVRTLYLQEKNPSFEDMRHKLNTEPGVIICNHPSHFEALAVLEMIKRKDVKGIVARNSVAASVFGEGNFITVDPTASRSEFERQIEEMRSYVRAGGLLVFFPSGGKERTKGEFVFKGGFGMFLKKVLEPTDMVYTCNVNVSDANALKKETLARTIGVVLGFSTERKPAFRQRTLRMDERYTTAAEWQSVLQSADSRKDENRALTEHYLSKFPSADKN